MFRYLTDPLFLIAVGIYLINRICLEPLLEFEFLHSHLNDIICIPFLVPPMLAAARRIGLRSHDLPPTTSEIVVPVIVWSIMFEILLPLSPFWRQWITGDPYDVMWYAIGAAIASHWWRSYYRQSPRAPCLRY